MVNDPATVLLPGTWEKTVYTYQLKTLWSVLVKTDCPVVAGKIWEAPGIFYYWKVSLIRCLVVFLFFRYRFVKQMLYHRSKIPRLRKIIKGISISRRCSNACHYWPWNFSLAKPKTWRATPWFELFVVLLLSQHLNKSWDLVKSQLVAVVITIQKFTSICTASLKAPTVSYNSGVFPQLVAMTQTTFFPVWIWDWIMIFGVWKGTSISKTFFMLVILRRLYLNSTYLCVLRSRKTCRVVSIERLFCWSTFY